MRYAGAIESRPFISESLSCIALCFASSSVGSVTFFPDASPCERVTGLAVVIHHSLAELLHFVVRRVLRRESAVFELGHSVHRCGTDERRVGGRSFATEWSDAGHPFGPR